MPLVGAISNTNCKYKSNNRMNKKFVRTNKKSQVRTNAQRCKMAAEDDEGDV